MFFLKFYDVFRVGGLNQLAMFANILVFTLYHFTLVNCKTLIWVFRLQLGQKGSLQGVYKWSIGLKWVNILYLFQGLAYFFLPLLLSKCQISAQVLLP